MIKQTVILVYGTNYAVRAEHLLTRVRIPCRLIPVPRTLSSECGICVSIATDDKERALAELTKQKLEIEGIHDL